MLFAQALQYMVLKITFCNAFYTCVIIYVLKITFCNAYTKRVQYVLLYATIAKKALQYEVF